MKKVLYLILFTLGTFSLYSFTPREECIGNCYLQFGGNTIRIEECIARCEQIFPKIPVLP